MPKIKRLKPKKWAFTPAELEADHRGRIHKNWPPSRPTDQELQATEIALAITQLKRELRVSLTFILATINAILISHIYPAVLSLHVEKKDKDPGNQQVMAEIKNIYEEHQDRYGQAH